MLYIATFLSYVTCFAVTTFAIAPLQATVLPEITVFASLIYLPHGVRVLATWALGWRAIPVLALANYAAAWAFIPESTLTFLEPVHLASVFVGAAAPFIVFEVLRLFGRTAYFGRGRQSSWRTLLLAGALASILNSLGQSVVYAGLITAEIQTSVLFFYLVGDTAGLIVCLIALMFGFRWYRRGATNR